MKNKIHISNTTKTESYEVGLYVVLPNIYDQNGCDVVSLNDGIVSLKIDGGNGFLKKHMDQVMNTNIQPYT